MIPVTVMVTGKGTVSKRLKGEYSKEKPSRFTNIMKPVIFWNITYKCNLQCQHCYMRSGPWVNYPELSKDELLHVASQIIEQESPLVVFTGGEPLVKAEFWDVAKYLSHYRKPALSLSSNGTLITGKVANDLADLGFRYVGVSIDSVDPSRHDGFRGMKGAYERAIEGIRNVIDVGIPAGIRTTITANNYKETRGIVDLAYRLGVRRVSLYLLDTVGRGLELRRELLTPGMVAEWADSLIELARAYQDSLEILVVRGNFVGIYIAWKLASSKEEFMEYLSLIEAQGDCGRKTASIYPDGTVRPCQFIDHVVIGDLRKDSLKDILNANNPRLRPFLNVSKHLRGSKCSKCPFNQVCGGGSRNRAYAVNGDYWGDDPLCPLDIKLLSRFIDDAGS
ncbi:MAG: radical SAM protein [Desulfurococcales archaeon]|nr:radical SAM protein [Desulfurococcales archaeon]